MSETPRPPSRRPTLAPWLTVRGSAQAVSFYQSAFGAVETYHLDGPDDSVVSRLSVGDSEFWVSEGGAGSPDPQTLGGATARFILTVPDPDALFARAIAAGARQVYPVIEEHGWRVGRVVDPFGHHWEIGKEIAEPPAGDPGAGE